MSSSTAAWKQAEAEFEDEVVGENTIPRLFEQSASRHADRDAQWYKGGVYERSLTPDVLPAAPSGEFESLTYETMQEIVRNLSAGFRELGVENDTRVGIFANTRMEWAQSDFAILAAGGVVTTVYTESSPNQVQYLLDDPNADGVVVENGELLERVLEVEDELDLSFIVVIDDFDGHDDRDDILSLAEVHDLGDEHFDQDAYESRLAERDLDDLASLIYTSGTTGKPKGVQLTHRNFRSNVNGLRKRFAPRPDKDEDLPAIDERDRVLSFLPLAHVFERVAGHFLMFGSGATVSYAESTDTVADDIQIVKPTGASSVPRVYERIYDSLRDEAPEAVFNRAVPIARQWANTESPGLGLKLKYKLMDKLVYSSVREQMGGNIEFFVSGGGSLSKQLAELFDGMGIPILEGYGLTETSPVVSVNPPEDYRSGTLGPPLSNVEVRLDETVVSDDQKANADGDIGELHVKGPNVTEGYWNRPGATEEAFTQDGWFRTGDIIEQTDDDYLIYHDRLKQLIVLDTGKNIAPQPIEDEFATSERIDQAMVIGDNQKFIAALFVPNLEAVERWADKEGIDLPDDSEAICADSRVREYVNEEVEEVNKTLSKSEKIKEFRLVPIEWTADNDLLTPSMKIKRRNVMEQFEEQVQDIYGDDYNK
ncbi:acyl-CoA synthetase [Natronomonas pharaonis DSM 2160]|uniref:Acyl-CoA synthetase n=1 Tax=Natronomonas pharaonis (strain ATCC 35678 / DSM 2160 / CIP 103997 / JCM 8858 / NBRC 14720 / NCIMB 2260 / Gabara) TaxID=348780 RepID=A0A1U7EY98_NATPD|nr:long-chain fatty acid--CoA ligase [Natronomonas pharaonis]CAI50178.1 acyl-CoA synthetase [Natronomonas pharaonis DSM 2160]